MLKWTRRKKEIKTDWSIFAMTKLRPSFVINHKSLIAVIIYISSEVVNQKACDSLYLHLFLKLKDSDVVAFHHYSLAFLSTISSQNEHCIVGHSTSSQGLPAFNPIWSLFSGMFEFHERAHARLFLHYLEAYHSLESTQISFAEAHSYPMLLY